MSLNPKKIWNTRKERKEEKKRLAEGAARLAEEKPAINEAQVVKKTRQDFRKDFYKFHKAIDLETVTDVIIESTKEEEKKTEHKKEFKILKDSRKEAERFTWDFILREDPESWYENTGIPQTGTISGIVRDEDDKPVTDAIMHLEHPDERGKAVQGFGVPRKYSGGAFTFEDVPPGRYIIVARKAVQGVPVYGVQEQPKGEIVIDPQDPAKREAKTVIRFFQHTFVKGRAIDASGEPIPKGEAIIALVDPHTEQVMKDVDGNSCVARVGEDGEFIIPHVPLSTAEAQHPFIVTGMSTVYGHGGYYRTGEKHVSDHHEIVYLTAAKRAVDNVVVQFQGTAKLSAEIRQPKDGAEVKELVAIEVYITGGTGKEKNTILTEIEGTATPLFEPAENRVFTFTIAIPRFWQRMPITLSVISDGHSIGRVTIYAMPDKQLPPGPRSGKEHIEEAIIVQETDDHGRPKGASKVIHLPPGVVADGESQASEGERAPAVEDIDAFVEQWNFRAENQPWREEEIGSYKDMLASLYRDFPVLLAARGVFKSVPTEHQIEEVLQQLRLKEPELRALWMNTRVARMKYMYEFVQRWHLDHQALAKPVTIEAATQQMFTDYLNTSRWDSPGFTEQYKRDCLGLLGRDFLRLAYNSIVGKPRKALSPGETPQGVQSGARPGLPSGEPVRDKLEIIKQRLREEGAPEEILDEIHTLDELEKEQAALLLWRARRDETR